MISGRLAASRARQTDQCSILPLMCIPLPESPPRTLGMRLLSRRPPAQETWSRVLLAGCPFLIADLAASSPLAPGPPLLPPAPSQGGSFGLCQSITKREVTSPSRVPPCPRPAYPLPWAAPENMTHPGWGREPSPGVLSPNQAEWAQAALFPTPAPTLGWRLLCLVGAVTVLEAMPRDPNTPQASPSTSWVAPGE